jgi:uncharacterized membrane protein (DUF106 family)
MTKDILIEILTELGIEKSGVSVKFTTDYNHQWVDFYFGRYNLYGSYKLCEVTVSNVINELDKFLSTNDNYKIKRSVILREYLIDEVLKIN